LFHGLRILVPGRGVRVPTVEGARPYVNLDNGASTPTFEPIWAAFRQAWRQPVDVQQALIQEARAIAAGFVGAPPSDYDVVFTANTTDAINLVAESTGRAGEHGIQPVVINTLLEHNSNELPWRSVPGATLLRLPMNGEGFLDLRQLIDYLAFSAHKAYAPVGTGVLVARKGLLAFSPAEMEGITSAGEENVGGIANPASPSFAHKGGVIPFYRGVRAGYVRPWPKGNSGFGESWGTSSFCARTASIDDGSSNGILPTGAKAPVTTSSRAWSVTPKCATRAAESLAISGMT
jgi:hypothetical protein